MEGMRIMAIGVLVLGALGLVGCVPEDRPPTSLPTPSGEPVFESEEEALAAAEDAYAAYLEMSDLIASEGGANPERIADFVTEEREDVELEGFREIAERGIHLDGHTEFETLELQRLQRVGAETEVAFYVCWDASQTRFLNAEGEDITPRDRNDRLMLEVVVSTTGGSLPLVLVSDEAWQSSSAC